MADEVTDAETTSPQRKSSPTLETVVTFVICGLVITYAALSWGALFAGAEELTIFSHGRHGPSEGTDASFGIILITGFCLVILWRALARHLKTRPDRYPRYELLSLTGVAGIAGALIVLSALIFAPIALKATAATIASPMIGPKKASRVQTTS